MLVAQSYSHRTMTSTLPRHNKRDATSRQTKKELNEKRPEPRDGKPKFMTLMTSPTSSKPVVIPTKTSSPKRKSRKEEQSPPQDVDTVPRSMAALLAVASGHGRSTRHGYSDKLSRGEKLSPDDLRFSLSSSSPKSWSILQSPPGEEDDSKECEGDAFSMTSGGTVAPLSSFRSLSSESMPSLDTESDFDCSFTSELPTPGSRGRRESKKLVSPRSSLGGWEHPLSPTEQETEIETPTQDKTFDFDVPLVRAPTPKSLKSNLSASLRILKSAARSTLSTISPTQYTANPLSSFKTPVVESPPAEADTVMYGNIDALPFHLTSALPDLPMAKMSIQLMPYSQSNVNATDTATAPPVFLPASQPSIETIESKSLPRPREPRENSDFLRVVVMEMNMRRAGKLKSEGKARIWLGARKDVKEFHDDQALVGEQRRSSQEIPARWSSISI